MNILTSLPTSSLAGHAGLFIGTLEVETVTTKTIVMASGLTEEATSTIRTIITVHIVITAIETVNLGKLVRKYI